MVENKEPYLDSPEDGLPDPVPEPESKRARYEDEDDKEDMYMKHLQIFNQIDSGYLMDIELDLASNRQKKAFQRNPSLYLAKKLAGSEVCFRRLSANEKELFKRAMNSEVSSFIKTEAVRRCQDGYWFGNQCLRNHVLKHLLTPGRMRTQSTALMALAKQRRG